MLKSAKLNLDVKTINKILIYSKRLSLLEFSCVFNYKKKLYIL